MAHSSQCKTATDPKNGETKPPFTRPSTGATLVDVGSVVLVWTVGAAVFFRVQLSSGFNKIMGDDGDTRLIVYLCEHWYRLFGGVGRWRSPAFFHPLQGLLGWSDVFFLYGIFYSPLRFLGADPFFAFQMTLVLLSAVGFGSFVTLVRQFLGAPRVVALVGGLVFTFSNTLWMHVNSPQLLGVYLIPPILLLGGWSWRALPHHPARSASLAGMAGLLWALLFYTTYYVAWFSALAAMVALVVAMIGARRRSVSAAVSVFRIAWRSITTALAAFILGIIPFVLTYIPVLAENGAQSYGDTLYYAPYWQDLIDVGPGNLFWSGLVDHLVRPGLLAPYEVQFGLTPILLLVALGGGGMMLRRLWTHSAARPGAARTAVVLASTVLILLAIPIRFGNVSLWALVRIIPGAMAIRVADRLEVLTGLAVSVALVAAATEFAARLPLRRHARLLRIVGLLLLLVIVVEQYNTTPKSGVSRPAQIALLRSAAPAPAACHSFYVVNTVTPAMPYLEYQVDAMLVSQKLSIPTLNGYTAHNPIGWNLEFPNQPGYGAAVAQWAHGHGVILGLCQLDLGTMQWSTRLQLQK